MTTTVSASEPTEPDNLPALVVTFGTTARKRRVLEKSTSLLGRGKGCDIRLDSVEISTVHCVITHTACGLAIRDCDSRVGTLVNDQPVKEGTLSHGDVLQLGPFSFRVHIPKGWPPTLPALMRTSDSQTTGSTELGSNTGVPAEQLANVAERIFAVEERERELTRTRQELEKQAADLEEQKRQLHAERHADLDHLATYKSEIEALKHSYTEQAAQLEEARAARERMTAEHEALMYPLREQNLAIQARLDQAYSELDSLRSSVMQTRMDLPEEELGEQGTVLRHQLSQQQQVIESLERELHEARTVVQVEQQARLDTLQQELAQVRQELAENRQHRERLEQELAAATPRPEDTLATEVEQLRAQLAESQATNEHLTRQLMRMSETTDLVPVADSEEIERELEESREEIRQLREQLENAESLEGSELRAQLEQASSEIVQLREQLATVEIGDSTAIERELEQVRNELAVVIGINERLEAELAQRAQPGEAPACSSEDLESLQKALAETAENNRLLQQRLETEHTDHERRLAAIRQELERERQQVKQLVQEAAKQFTSTQNELQDLRAQAAASSGTMRSMQQGVPAEYVAQLEREIESLRAIAADLEAQLRNAGPAVPTDLAEYENQLNEFRVQLEEAQAGLQQQEVEIQEKIRQTELQVSRERAEIGRERVALERIRLEVRTELEHAEREAKNFERMAGVHKLASEVRGPQRAADDDNSLSGRIRGFLKRMGE